jgi:hypothetical protein
MTANTSPIYTLTPHVGWTTNDGDGGTAGPVKTGNAAVDGTAGTTTVFTAGANGSYLQRIRFRAAGTNVATVARVYINNGSSSATNTNNAFWDEITLAATTASSVAALQTYELPLNFPVAAGYKILISLGTTVAAGYTGTLIGGDY